MSLKILCVFGLPLRIGGHFKSAISHMKYLKGQGHDIWVLAPGGAQEMIRQFNDIGVEVRMFRQGPKRGCFPSSLGSEEISQLAGKNAVELIHCQEFKSLAASYKAAISLNKGFVYSKAGGPVNDEFGPGKADAVFYSEELLDGMVKRHNLRRDNITVIRARIDMSVYKPVEVSRSFIEKYSLPKTGKKIAMAIRLRRDKKPWFDNILRFAEQIDLEREIHIVIAGEGPLLETVKEKASEINDRCGVKWVHLIGPIFEMSELNQFYNYADIVVGTGRGILEAMACSKGVIILGENGEGEIVGPDNIADIAYFNFSGRHFRHVIGRDKNLSDILNSSLTNEETLAQAGEFSFSYIKNSMSAEVGAKELLNVYRKAVSKKHVKCDYFKWYLKVARTTISSAIKRRLSVGVGH